MRRRTFVGTILAALGGLFVVGCDAGEQSSDTDDGRQWLMPDEGAPHARTWMAFAANERIWGSDLVPVVQQNLATIATTIARFEPVTMLVSAKDRDRAQSLIGDANVELVTADLDDLWMRDTGPVFVRSGNTKAGVGFNFNGWGDKQEHRKDAKMAALVCERAGVEALETDLVLEGGALESDGDGTAIITESCVLNDNRNPGWSKQDVEDELRYLLGVEKVIWLPGVAGKDITDGHTDFYARFAQPGVVVAGLDNDPDSFDHDVTRRHLDILRNATDARGRKLQVEVIEGRRRYARNSRPTISRPATSTSTCATARSSDPNSGIPEPIPPRWRRWNACSRGVQWCRSISTELPPVAAASTARPSKNLPSCT